MKIKEIRLLSPFALRDLCIKKDWYTMGDVDEYSHLLGELTHHGRENITTDDLRLIAEDIMEHSKMDSDKDLLSVMYDVCDVTITVFSGED